MGALLRIQVGAIDDSAWVGYARQHPEALVFHLPEWTSVVADCFGFEAFSLLARDAAGKVVAGCPIVLAKSPLGKTKWVSLPFTDECPLLMDPDVDARALAADIESALASRNEPNLQIRGELPAMDGVYPLARGVFHVSALSDDEAAVAGHASKMHRRNVRTAERAGVTIRRSASLADVDEFYRLHCITRRRLGVPVQPRKFFALIHERLIDTGMGWVTSASYDGATVASAIFLAHGPTVIYKFGASDRAYEKTRANHLLFANELRHACESGYRRFDWGRSDFDAEGLRAFKSGWGAEEAPLVYTQIGDAPAEQHGSTIGPLAQSIIQRSPIWVCRALGAILYRWAA